MNLFRSRVVSLLLAVVFLVFIREGESVASAGPRGYDAAVTAGLGALRFEIGRSASTQLLGPRQASTWFAVAVASGSTTPFVAVAAQSRRVALSSGDMAQRRSLRGRVLSASSRKRPSLDLLAISTTNGAVSGVAAVGVFKRSSAALTSTTAAKFVAINHTKRASRGGYVRGRSAKSTAPKYDALVLLRVARTSVATNTPGLRVTAANPSASELRAANYLADQGESVVLRDPIGTRSGGGTSDLLVGGKPWDVYSPTTGNVDRIVSAVAKKGSQVNGGGVIIDLSGSTVKPAQLANIEARLAGMGANVGKVVVIR